MSVGIFPYVLKLLQTSAMELRQILVFIWTKILSLDKVVFYVENLKSLTVHFISQDSGIYLVALFFK